MIVQTDSGNAAQETTANRANNVKAQRIELSALPPADLVLLEPSIVAPDQAFEGSTIKVRYAVENKGAGATDRPTWTDAIWLTRAPNRMPSAVSNSNTTLDYLLTTVGYNSSSIQNYTPGELAENKGYETKDIEVVLPNNIEAGDWYITPWTNALNEVYEVTSTNTQTGIGEIGGNNYKSRKITILKTPKADLTVNDLQINSTSSLEAGSNTPVKISWTVRNEGQSATNTNRWQDTVYLVDRPLAQLQRDSFGRIITGNGVWVLGTYEHSTALARNATATGSLETWLAPSAAGQYIVVETDTWNTVQ